MPKKCNVYCEQMSQQTVKKPLNLKNLTKGNVWDLEEKDVFRMLEAGEKDADTKDSMRHYYDLLRGAFMIDEIKSEGQVATAEKKKFERLDYKVGQVKLATGGTRTIALKKKPINRVTDLTYENIRHITAAKLLEVIDRNFGGGWDSLSQSIRDIIESGFDISTITLPQDRIKKKGSMYEKKIADGFDSLFIQKGTWVEVIFAKVKPLEERPRMKFGTQGEQAEEDEDEDNDMTAVDNFNAPDEDDDEFVEPTDEELNEENYSTMMELGNPDEDGEELAEEEYSED